LRDRLIRLKSRAMAFYKATLVWLLVMAAIGWGCYQTVHPTKPSFLPILGVVAAFTVLVAFTGCKVDEPEEGH